MARYPTNGKHRSHGEQPVEYRVRDRGRHGEIFGYRINALVFWVVLFHTSLFIPSGLSFTLLFLGHPPWLAFVAGLVTVLLSLAGSLAWARWSYRREIRRSLTLRTNGSEAPEPADVRDSPADSNNDRNH